MAQKFFPFFSNAICFAVIPHLAYSLPEDPKVIAGSAEIKHLDSHTMQIKATDRTILNYSKFGIGKGEKVKFVQESPSSSILNKVTSKDPSKILGSLESNGKVFLVNPNGVYFGPESKVNVGSLIVSTLHMADEDFLQGKYEFHLTDQIASIQNEGSLIASDLIAFISPQIQNKGLIQAKAAVFAAGKHVALDFAGDGLMQFSVEGSLKEALIEHLGEIQSSNVTMKIPAAKKAISEIVNIDGAEMGEVFTEENGIIKLASLSSIKSDRVILEGAHLEMEGSIDSTSSLAKGGEVHLFGREINLKDAFIDVSGTFGGGTVLIGGEYQGGGKTPYASTVIMDKTSQIFTNALESGDGGLVVLWSQDKTVFDGHIESKGGILGGNGGLIETSSNHLLKFATGYVNTSAPQGNYGNWLLDPYTISINNAYLPDPCPNSCGNASNVFCDENPSVINNSLSNFTVQADTINLTSPLSLQPGVGITFAPCGGSATINLNASVTTNGGFVTFNSGMHVSLGASVAITTSGGNVAFGSTIDGAQSLTIAAGSGTVSFAGAIGGSSPLTNLALTSAGSISVANNMTITGANPLTFPSTVSLTGPVTILSNNANVSFSSTLSGTQPLIIEAGTGSVSFVGDVSLNSLNVSAGPITQNSTLTLTGDVNYSGSSLTVGAVNAINVAFVDTVSLNITAGDISAYAFSESGGGAVTLGNNVTASSTTLSFADNITLTQSATLTAMGNLTVANVIGTGTQVLNLYSTAQSIFAGELGTSANALSTVTLTANGISSVGGIVTAGQSIDIRPPLLITSSPTTLDTTAGGTLPGNTIHFQNTVDATSSGVQGLILQASSAFGSGTVAFDKNVGSKQALAFLTVNGTSPAGINLQGSIVTTGAIEMDPPITLTGNSSMTTSGGAITLSSVDSPGSLYSLTLNASGAGIETGALGSSNALGAVSLTGADITVNGPITTSGNSSNLTITNSGTLDLTAASSPISVGGYFSQTGTGPVSLGNNITANGGLLSFTGMISLTSTPISLTGYGITLSGNVDGASALTLNPGYGDVTLGALGFGTALQSLDVNGSNNTVYIANGVSVESYINIYTPYAMILTGDVTFSSATPNNSINLSVDAINGSNGGGQSLTLNTAGSTVDLGPAGFTVPLGEVIVNASTFRVWGITTNQEPITINAATAVRVASVTLDTTNKGKGSGADLSFFGTVDTDPTLSGNNSLSLTAGNGEILFSSDIGSIDPLGSLIISSASNVDIENVTVISNISISPHTTLSLNGFTIFTSNAEGNISLGRVDGTVNGAQSLSVVTTGPVTLGNLGLSIYLGEVNVLTGSSATIQSVYTSGEINIVPPVTLASSTALNSSFAGGADISLTSVDGTVSGTQNFSVIAGSGDFTLSGDLGAVIPTGSLSIQAASILLEGTKMYAAGTHLYDGSVLINQSAAFRSLGDMTFESRVDPVSANAPDLALYPGGGILTFQDAVGDAPFGTVAVYNASSFLAEDIFAENLAVGGGLGSIFLNGDVNLSGIAGAILDAGPIFLGGAINTRRIWFRSQGSMTSLGSSQAINTSNNSVLFPQYLNAIKGNIGSLESPIEINTVDSIRVGALDRADFIGDPDHTSVEFVRFNKPCFVTFNGTLILDGCSIQPSSQNIFNSLAKTLFYVPGIYSSWSWDNLSNPWYFEEMPFYLASNPRDRTLFYREVAVHHTRSEKRDLKEEKLTPQKEAAVSWEFKVELPQNPPESLKIEKSSLRRKISLEKSNMKYSEEIIEFNLLN